MIALAIIPTIVLMIYIYKMDSHEKESIRLLLLCLLFGVLSTIPSVVTEIIGEDYLEPLFEYGSYAFAFVDTFIVTGLAEELFKFLALRILTFKSSEFNCKFDAIVYAVFVSMGFAAFENVFYLIDGTFTDAMLRAFTSIPGHACFAVFMGYFYSKAKYGSLYGNKKMVRKNSFLAILVPVILHGIYNFLLSVDENVVGENASLICFFIWCVYVLALFIVSFILVKRTSKGDMPFSMQRVTWECSCGKINNGNFCSNCGARKLSVLRH